jgi:hypothetical protein
MDRVKKKSRVGYCKPPAHTRFQKGRSGNPNGRPAGPLNIQDAMQKALRKTVIVTENGMRKRMSMAEVIVTRLANRVTSGDPKAIVTATAILRYGREAAAAGPIEISMTEDEMKY